MAEARRARRRGNSELALQQYLRACTFFAERRDDLDHSAASAELAQLYKSVGKQALAVDAAEEAFILAKATGRVEAVLKAQEVRALVYLLSRNPKYGEDIAAEALAMARAQTNHAAAARILNNLGGNALNGEQWIEAANRFDQAVADARRAGDEMMEAQALANGALADLELREFTSAHERVTKASAKLAGREGDEAANHLWLLCGQIHFRLAMSNVVSRATAVKAAHACDLAALQSAQKLDDKLVMCHAQRALAQLYAAEGRNEEALQWLEPAVLLARGAELPDTVWRCEWDLARLQRALGRKEQAVINYGRAIESLQRVRHDCLLGVANAPPLSSFRNSYGNLFLQAADLLLEDSGPTRNALVEARNIVEALKGAELEDYFRDDCVGIARTKIRGIDRLEAHTAVVYIIPLPSRTELLLSAGADLERFTLKIDESDLTRTVVELRRKLEKRQTREYLPLAQRLYRELVAPIEGTLASKQIDTLVFVPDGALRTIPMAALHDGSQFLAEKFALAVTPGLELMDPRPLPRNSERSLLSGISESVQNFSRLPHVTEELERIQQAQGGLVLLNKQCSTARLEQELGGVPYSVVHIASHAEFDRDASKTFLLTYDGRLTLNNLESLLKPRQFRGDPVELLTLSACETAAGDERAALGLAGIALKAGARSALGTLWHVSDEASSTLVTEFYRQLHEGQLTKAKALQAAQRNLILDARYQHPAFWSPYLIIGNWL